MLTSKSVLSENPRLQSPGPRACQLGPHLLHLPGPTPSWDTPLILFHLGDFSLSTKANTPTPSAVMAFGCQSVTLN